MNKHFKTSFYDLSQDKLLNYGLTINDAFLLQWFSKFQSTNKMEATIVNGKVLYWLSYSKVLKDIPLAFTSDSTLKRRINHMIEKNILIKHLDKTNQKVFIGMGENYENLFYWSDVEVPEVEEKPKKEKVISEKRLSDWQWFWTTYDKKVGKDKAFDKFMKLKEEDVDKIKATLENYIKANSDKEFRKHPTTYINSKAWNDEIISKGNNKIFTSKETNKKIYKELD